MGRDGATWDGAPRCSLSCSGSDAWVWGVDGDACARPQGCAEGEGRVAYCSMVHPFAGFVRHLLTRASNHEAGRHGGVKMSSLPRCEWREVTCGRALCGEGA